MTDPSNQLWQELFPFPSSYLQLAGRRLHYVDTGKGLPVLMVHGNPTWSFYYRKLISRLAANHRAIAVDHLGCGLSDKPVDYPYCLRQHIANLIALIDSLQLSNATLVAHDWGGAIGLGALLQRRDVFRKIVLLNTAAFPPPFIPFRIRVCRWPVFGKLAVQGLNLFARCATVMATEQPGGLPPQVAQGMLAPYQSWSDRTAIYQFVRDIPLSKSHPTWDILANIELQLPQLADFPVQLIWGMKDWCFRPECLARFISHWPHADVQRLDGAGHYVLEDEPEKVLRIVEDFLQQN